MAGKISGIKVTVRPLDKYEVQQAANTVAQAREHLANPKMVAAMKKHVGALNAAVTGPLKPKSMKVKR